MLYISGSILLLLAIVVLYPVVEAFLADSDILPSTKIQALLLVIGTILAVTALFLLIAYVVAFYLVPLI